MLFIDKDLFQGVWIKIKINPWWQIISNDASICVLYIIKRYNSFCIWKSFRNKIIRKFLYDLSTVKNKIIQ